MTSDAFQIFPELHGTTQTKMDAPVLHLPDTITVITDVELQQLIDIPPLEIQKLSDIHECVTTSLQTYDVESLLHTRQTSLLQEKRTNYLITITTSLCAFVIFGILCFVLYCHSRYGPYCVCKTDKAISSSENHPEPGRTEGETGEQKVLFASYSQQQTSRITGKLPVILARRGPSKEFAEPKIYRPKYELLPAYPPPGRKNSASRFFNYTPQNVNSEKMTRTIYEYIL